MKKILLLIFFTCLACTSVWAQKKVISGQVTSYLDGNPIPGVNIVIQDTNSGTITDIEGNYSIAVGESDILVFSFVGYNPETVNSNSMSGQTLNITLSEDIKSLSEIVVVGYGTQQKKDITSAIATVDADEIDDLSAYSFDGALQGRVSGVNISTSSGTPGAGINVNIRGATSIGASSQPLYVIDGIPLVTANNSALDPNIQPVNPLADINPNDIESISILKDASSSAIYGSRGANGVVLITTKRGQAGKTKFNLGYYTGFQRISNTVDMMSSKQWIEFMNVAAANDGLGEGYWNEVLGDPEDPDLQNTRIYDELFRTAPISNYELSAQGGTDKTQFFVSGNFFDQEGILVGSGFKRVSGRVNLSHQTNDKLSFGTNLSFGRSVHDRTLGENDEYGVLVNASAWDPTAPLYNEDGTYTHPFSYNGWWALDNPLKIAKEYTAQSKSITGLASFFAQYEIVDGLNFKTQWSVDYNTLDDEFYAPSFSQQSLDEKAHGIGEYGSFKQLGWINENTLSYSRLVKDAHSFNLLGGFTMQETKIEFTGIRGIGYAIDENIKIENAAKITGASTGSTAYGLQSFFGRLNYGYRDKYLLTATLRADGSSRFGSENRYGYFPSASFAWRVTEEPFMESARNLISDLKFRVSYGITGNQEIGDFTWRRVWNLTSPYFGNGGTQPESIGNKDLTWEGTTQTDFGLDIGLFNNRVNISADYFEKTTKDLLLDADIPGTTGFYFLTQNAGEIENKGFELSLNTVNVNIGDFAWTSNFNISFIRNQIVDVVNDGEVLGRNFILKEGEPLSTFYLIKFLGVDPATGDAMFEDINGDNYIDQDDRQIVGSAQPDYFGGFTNTFSYKGLSFSTFIQFVEGNEIYNQSRFAYEQYGSLRSGIPYGNSNTRSLNYWKEPGDITDIPRPSLAGQSSSEAQYQRFSTQYLEDGSFVRLKNVKLSYKFHDNWVKKAGFSSVSVFAQGTNLITWTDYLGFDPGVSTNTASQGDLNTQQGEDFGTLGQARTFTFGFNIGF